jgi:hypothetical protein
MKYNHLQIAKVTIALIILATVITVLSIIGTDYSNYSPEWMDSSDWDLWGIGIVILVYLVVINFTFLRIQIDKQYLSWHFGIGIPRKTILLSDIESVKQVRNRWWYGWGIRKLLSGGWLYNVYGLDAVEVITRQGKIVRLGTDEPKQLKKALVAVTQVENHG